MLTTNKIWKQKCKKKVYSRTYWHQKHLQKCSNNISIHAKQCLYFHILISYLWTFIYFFYLLLFLLLFCFLQMRFNLLSENTFTSSTDSRMPNASASALKLIKYFYVYLLFWKQQFYGIKIWNIYRWWIFLGGIYSRSEQ